MKYKVTYFVVDKSDNNNQYDVEMEAKDRADVHKQLRKKHKGCHIHSITIKPIETVEDAAVEVKRCPTCNKQLTDGGQCPVCDLGDEEAREGHTIYSMDESMDGKEFRELLAIAKEIGIKDAKDLLRFYHDHPAEDKDKLAVIKDYRAELGDDFKLKESCNKVLREAKEDAIKARAKKDKEAGVALDPLNPDDMEAVADEYGYDEEETATYKKHYFEESANEVSVEKFWGLVCSGKDDEIFKICSDDRDPKKNYNRFGSDHSYIMGALRNGNYSTAKILLTFGHKILEHESYEVVAELLKAKGIK